MISICYRESIGFLLSMSELFITKDLKTGKSRFIVTSSSSYEDRDREIITEEALIDAVEDMWATKDFGTLRWFHTKVVLGHVDFADIHAHQLIESGLFVDEEVAKSMATHAYGLKVSIGFNGKPKDGMYHKVRIKERSLLPDGKESNPYTNLIVTGGEMKNERLESLIERVGEEKALQLLTTAETVAKEADERGHTRKEKKDKSLWQQFKEALGAIPDPEEGEEDEDESDDDTDELEVESVEEKKPPMKKEVTPNEDNQPRLTLEQVKEYVATEFQAFRDEQATLRTKETSTLATKDEVAQVVETQSKYTEALTEVSTQLKELRGEQPRVFGQYGYRASQAEDTKTGEKAKKQDAPKSGISAIREQLESQVTGG